ncbi:MAG: hypothetical protein R6V06_00890 [Kiritimatiellia bacterium]
MTYSILGHPAFNKNERAAAHNATAALLVTDDEILFKRQNTLRETKVNKNLAGHTQKKGAFLVHNINILQENLPVNQLKNCVI